jgi:hypothetical protein
MPQSPSEPLPLDTPRDLARAITRIERGGPAADEVMRRLGPRPLRAWTACQAASSTTSPPSTLFSNSRRRPSNRIVRRIGRKHFVSTTPLATL